MMLMKKIMEDMAERSSCLATKGQRTQFTKMGTAVPTKKHRPMAMVKVTAASSLGRLCRFSDTTVKDMQPINPDRYVQI